MKRFLSIILCTILLAAVLPGKQAAAYNSPSIATIVSGEEYYGVTPVNEAGYHVPVRYELPVEQNSILRIILYTQTEFDGSIYVENESSPNDKADNYGQFPGSDLTLVKDFYNPSPNVLSNSSFCVTADKRNTNEYTEVFGDIAKGNYYIVVRGDKYRFKIIIEPLKYAGEFNNMNYTRETAAPYTIGNTQEGVLLSNGIINNNFIENVKSDHAWYKFTAGKGKYHLNFYTDGFFQGSADVLDSSGYPVNGNYIKAEAYFKFNNSDELAGTFEEHLLKAGLYSTAFELTESGTYYVHINRRTWTTGSYMFQITSDQEAGGKIEVPAESPSGDAEAALDSIRIDPAAASIKAGSTIALKAAAYYNDYSSEDITEFTEWSSSDNRIATVDENGVVKGISAGTATVTAKLEGKQTSVTVQVTAAKKLKKIVPQKSSIYMKTGTTAVNKITAYYSDGSKVTVTDKVVLSSSSASINIFKNRQLKAMKKGSCVVTVTYEGLKTTYKVTVK